MNILHVKYAVEVAQAGSLSKAAEKLLVAQPNLSRSIRELEADLGITIFERTAKGMTLTMEGDEFIGYAKSILLQIDQMEKMYKDGGAKKQKFSISVPRACYIAEAFVQFSKQLSEDPAEIFYKETNSQRVITNMLQHDYKLGIIRYAENYSNFFKVMLEEKELHAELVTEFTYRILMSKDSLLAKKEQITFDDLATFVEVAHADPYVPSLPLAKVVKEELPDNVQRRIFIFERASQFDLLAENPETFMWVSPTPQKVLDRYGLVEKQCVENKKVYKDMLIYKKGYRLSELDHLFITELCNAKRKYI
ncbi:MAG: LysR family transcriptional regulator [Lachnospiraceae bacterium]|nr:LysR family transcriptional regulator [Lachnospiraceae bacterium]